jgi:hypothetical protein
MDIAETKEFMRTIVGIGATVEPKSYLHRLPIEPGRARRNVWLAADFYNDTAAPVDWQFKGYVQFFKNKNEVGGWRVDRGYGGFVTGEKQKIALSFDTGDGEQPSIVFRIVTSPAFQALVPCISLIVDADEIGLYCESYTNASAAQQSLITGVRVLSHRV